MGSKPSATGRMGSQQSLANMANPLGASSQHNLANMANVLGAASQQNLANMANPLGSSSLQNLANMAGPLGAGSHQNLANMANALGSNHILANIAGLGAHGSHNLMATMASLGNAENQAMANAILANGLRGGHSNGMNGHIGRSDDGMSPHGLHSMPFSSQAPAGVGGQYVPGSLDWSNVLDGGMMGANGLHGAAASAYGMDPVAAAAAAAVSDSQMMGGGGHASPQLLQMFQQLYAS